MTAARIGASKKNLKNLNIFNTQDKTMEVYKAISAVAAHMAREGISKARKNAQQGYNFRGIDDMYNALAPVISEHGLVILPRVMARQVVERQTQKGSALFYVTVESEFDFVCALDGSKHTVKTFGEAMDSADKATNKAMSAAYKYAVMQTFCIPTEGDNDADAITHEVRGQAGSFKKEPPRQSAAYSAPAMDDDEVDECVLAMKECESIDTLRGIFGAAWKRADVSQKKTLQTAYDAIKEQLTIKT